MALKGILIIIIIGVSINFVSKWISSQKSLIRDNLNKTYDYIIVGAGSAGCVLANRLSEDEKFSVLLLEAGEDDTKYPFISVPFLAPFLAETEADWNYKSIPQKYGFKSINNQQSPWTRGKVLGGSSSLNFMVYIRGSRYDYDGWASLGAQGWSYDDVLPYFKKSETNQNEELLKSGYHGHNGPLIVSDTENGEGLLGNIWLDAGKEQGFKHVDNNGEPEIGFSATQVTVNKGQRWSTAQAYLRPAMTRENLHVATNAFVTKVLFDKNKQATGVEFIRNHRLHRITARKEIILSAGSLNSPQILMLSGIGPKKHLQELGIPVLADLPVGKNLHDHVMTFVHFSTDQPISLKSEEAGSIWNKFKYLMFGTGPLGSPGGVYGNALFHTRHPHGSKTYPDLQFIQLSGTLGNNDTVPFKTLMGMNDEMWDFLKPFSEGYGFTSAVCLLHPKSVGELRLNTTNPYEPPIFDLQYLQHPDDIAFLIDGMKIAADLAKTKAFRDHKIKVYDKVFPRCKEFQMFSDEYWECYLRHMTATIYHYVGTCKMGSEKDNTTVVDPQLRVKGVKNLRVIDASVMPFLTSGNTNAPTIMIAEKGADLIKGK